MITAAPYGRGLAITVEGLEPFIIPAIPVRLSQWLTAEYFEISLLVGSNEHSTDELRARMGAVLVMSLEGAVWEENGNPSPPPLEDQKHAIRFDEELSQSEGREVAAIAFFAGTVVAYDGVRAYQEAGGGAAGHVQAVTKLAKYYGLTLAKNNPVIDALWAIENRSHQMPQVASAEVHVESRKERRLRKRLARSAAAGVTA